MAKIQWFYAQGDEEFGPISSAELKDLAAAGQLLPEDLVWKEGMGDWHPSREVAGLFPNETAGAAPPAPEVAAEPAAPVAPPSPEPASATATRVRNVSAEMERPMPDAPPVVAAEPRPGRSVRRPGWLESLNLFRYGAVIGQPLLLLGLVMVLGAKGCDAVGNRSVGRLQARSQYEPRLFADAYETKRLAIEGKDQDAAARQKQLRELTEKRTKEEQELRRGRWRSLELQANYAELNNRSWGYWREIVFVLGTMILSVGLLAVGFTGEGAERWICLIMLAIVTFSLYIGGTAWISSLSGLIR